MYYLFYLRSYTARKIFVSRVKKKRQTRRHILNFFLISPALSSTKLAPPKHTSSDAKRRERRRGFFRFFCFFFVVFTLIRTFELNRPRRRSQEPTERVDVCCLNSKNDTVFTLYSYTPSSSLFIECLLLLYTSYLFNREREGERDTRLTQCWAFLGGGREQQQHPHTH